ncbi:MAG: hypothetical protein L0210_07750 [Rhodospirillales bacterium]|nr:hypothetical protein [Rhodospirillales bacterium]
MAADGNKTLNEEYGGESAPSVLAAERSMKYEHVLSGLIAKRAELAGKIDHAQTTLRQLIIDLDSLNATIRLFAPDIDLEDIKPKPLPPRHAAFKGEVARVTFGMLRQSSAPVSTHDLTMHVMAERGLDTADRRLLRTIDRRVGACLRHHRTKGLLRSYRGPEQFMVWEIAR